MPQKFPHSEQNEVSPAVSQQGREVAYTTLPFPTEQRELFVLCCSPTASEWGEKKVAFPFLGGWPTATPGYLPSLGEALLTQGEESCTWGMLPCKNFPTLSFSSLSLNFPIYKKISSLPLWEPHCCAAAQHTQLPNTLLSAPCRRSWNGLQGSWDSHWDGAKAKTLFFQYLKSSFQCIAVVWRGKSYKTCFLEHPKGSSFL